jgi:4-amino-4-deoxy-L-arabinose transferase-like glycosyltransferase
MPRVFAHAHLVALDMAVTAWFFVTAGLVAAALRRDSWGLAVAAGISFGLALLSKMNAFFLPVLLVPWGLIWYRRRWPKLALSLAVIGPAVFVIGWPWMWVETWPHLREYLGFHLGHAAYNVWYAGALYQYAPWHYPLVMTAITTPVLVLALAVGGAVRCRPVRRVTPERALLLLGLAVTLLPSALPGSPKYNGVRLFLPAFPFLAALAGGGFSWLLLRIVNLATRRQAKPALLSGLIGVALGAGLLLPGFRSAAALHPYQLAYYNELVGGTKGATERGFETVYWGQVFQEAPELLNGVAQRMADRGPLVLVIPKGCIYLLEMQQGAGKLDARVKFTGDEGAAAAADYVMFQAMQSDFTDLCWELVRNERPAWTFPVGGAPLLYIYERDAVRSARERLRQ